MLRKSFISIHCILATFLTCCSDSGSLVTSLAVANAAALQFSPDASLLMTWNKKAGEEPNLLIHCIATGERRAGFHQRQWSADVFAWSGDGKVAAKLFPDSVQLFDGAFPPNAAGLTPVPIGKIPAEGIKSMWLSPGAAPYTIVTFTARTKSKPGSVALWAFPKTGAPIAAKSLQADEARATFAPDGSAVLVEMSTLTSESSYYGDSRLFLFDKSGKIATPVPGLKEGPTHDFCWSPKSDSFVVIAGRSPPVATLHNKAGAPTFSFGTSAFNTAKFSPHGRFLMLGGFGNMPGDITLWDVNKKKPLGPTFNSPCTVTCDWSPDGRYLMTTTTRPRLNVDNGFKIFSHRGVLVCRQGFDTLFHAAWRPAPVEAFADRAASPEPPPDRVAACAAAVGSPLPASSNSSSSSGPGTPVAARSGGASPALTSPTGSSASGGVGSAAKPGGAYVPPHLRKSGATVNYVSEMMKADHKAAGAIKPGTVTAAATKDVSERKSSQLALPRYSQQLYALSIGRLDAFYHSYSRFRPDPTPTLS